MQSVLVDPCLFNILSMPQGGTVDLIPTGNELRSSFAQPVGNVVTDLIPTGNELRSSFAQPVGNVVTDLIPTGNELRSSFAQPVGKVVLNASLRFASPVQMRGSNRG